MNAQSKVEAASFDLTSYMERNGVLRIGRDAHHGTFNVYAVGNRFGSGRSVGEALRSAGVTA